MSKPFGFEKPVGMRDTLPLLNETKQKLRDEMNEEIRRWGFRFVETPALEYYDTVGSAASIAEQRLFKLLDQQGKTLVLRPDMTAPIARIAVSSMKNEGYPLRLAYDANVYRAQQREGGRPSEFEQIGVELIGDGSSSADAEVIALMAEVLRKSGLEGFQISIGHVGYVNELLVEIVGNHARAEQLRKFLVEKNFVGYRYHVKSLKLSSIDEKRLLKLLDLRGGQEVINTAAELIDNKQGKEMLRELSKLWDVLGDYGAAHCIKADFTLVSHMDYYTGVVFEGYDRNVGSPLCNGGRYDELLGKFGSPANATGFGIFFDRILEAIGAQGDQEKQTCIIFSPVRLKEAVELANEKRKNGERVVVQDLSGISDLDVFTKSFDDVIYCIGGIDKGEKQ